MQGFQLDRIRKPESLEVRRGLFLVGRESTVQRVLIYCIALGCLHIDGSLHDPIGASTRVPGLSFRARTRVHEVSQNTTTIMNR